MAAPVRVGILNDMSDDPSFIGVGRWVELAVGDLVRAGRLDREVELVVASAPGLPDGTAVARLRATLDARGLEATFATLEQSDE